MPRLIVHSQEGHAESIELRPGTNRLGRGRHNDFVIEHATVSTAHCEIIVEGDTVLVRDCGSTNGTFVKGQRIKEATLKPGEALRLGEVEMALENAPVTVAIPLVDFREPPAPPPLADGSMACLNHPEVRAGRRCTQCGRYFCEPCIHTLRRVGGRVLKLCPLCSGLCEIVPGKEGKRRKKSLLRSLWPFKKTLKMSRGQRHGGNVPGGK